MSNHPFGSLQSRRVLVTGGTSFLGSHLVRRLITLEAKVYCIIRPPSNRKRLSGCLDGIQILEGNLHERETVLQAIQKSRPEIVFHLATYGVDPRETDPITTIHTNVLGLTYLIEGLAQSPCQRFINTGSCFEYGNQNGKLSEEAPLLPLNVYAASKTMAWHLCNMQHQRNGFPVVTLRPFTFFGPYERPDRLIPSVIQAILLGKEIRITSGVQTRDYTYVEDMVEAYLLAAVSDRAVGQTFNIGSGTDYSVLEIVERIRKLMTSSTPIRVGALETRPREAWRLCCDPAKANNVLGWHPRFTFDEGLSTTIRWMTSQHEALVRGT